MSLFKTEEFWSTTCGQGETYCTSSLCVDNFFSNSHNFDQIITGSLNGYLRMFSSSQKPVDGDSNPFSLDKTTNSMDINMEYYLKSPIIQLEAGKFFNDSQKSLAVLTPNKLCLFDIDESNMTFKIVEEFILKRIAYNFCFGNFGHVSDREYICVQSTDTTLSFFVNGHLSFSCFLNDYLLPGPIQYLGTDDSIVIVNSNRHFEAYKYKSLAVLNSKNSDLTTPKSQKLATVDWSFNIGEDALEIKICDSLFPEQGSMILVLCRFSVFIMNVRNRTALKKRFDCRCKLLIGYGFTNTNEPRFIMSNNFNDLMIFHNTTLKWKAQMIHPNVIDIKIGKFYGLNGFIVTLSDSGQLAILFLGTDPSTDSVMLPSTRDSINSSNEDELAMLYKKISTITNSNTIGKAAPITIVKPSGESSKSVLKIFIDHSSASLSDLQYTINVTLKSAIDLRNVALRVSTHRPIASKQKSINFANLRAHNDITCRLVFLSTAAMVAIDLRVSVYATYDLDDASNSGGSTGGSGICQARFRLPMGLVMSRCAPCKQAQFKVTLDSVGGSNADVAPLSRLFPEFPASGNTDDQSTSQSDIAIAFRYHNDGPVVTILTSVAAKRYRLQSDHFEAIWLVMNEFSDRLARHFGGSSENLLKYSDRLPLDAYFLVLDFHFAVRTNLDELYRMLEQRSRQFRAIEKLFLTRTKDKSVAVANSSNSGGGNSNIDSLLENSINQLMQLADLVVEQQNHLAIVGNALCAATSTIGHLMQINNQPVMSPEQRTLLQLALGGDFPPDIGLEELYAQIVTFLLKSAVGQSKPTARSVGQLTVVTLQMPTPADIEKLKKHITMLCDRVAKGASLLAVSGSDQFGDDAHADGSGVDAGLKSFVTSPRSLDKPKKKKKKKQHSKLHPPIIE